MLLVIILLVISGTVRSEEEDGKYIDLLPEDEKREFIENIARRILEEVETKQIAKKPTVTISDDQMDETSSYVSKILKEEREDLNRRKLNAKKQNKSSDFRKGANKPSKDARIIDLTLRSNNNTPGVENHTKNNINDFTVVITEPNLSANIDSTASSTNIKDAVTEISFKSDGNTDVEVNSNVTDDTNSTVDDFNEFGATDNAHIINIDLDKPPILAIDINNTVLDIDNSKNNENSTQKSSLRTDISIEFDKDEDVFLENRKKGVNVPDHSYDEREVNVLPENDEPNSVLSTSKVRKASLLSESLNDTKTEGLITNKPLTITSYVPIVTTEITNITKKLEETVVSSTENALNTSVIPLKPLNSDKENKSNDYHFRVSVIDWSENNNGSQTLNSTLSPALSIADANGKQNAELNSSTESAVLSTTIKYGEQETATSNIIWIGNATNAETELTTEKGKNLRRYNDDEAPAVSVDTRTSESVFIQGLHNEVFQSDTTPDVFTKASEKPPSSELPKIPEQPKIPKTSKAPDVSTEGVKSTTLEVPSTTTEVFNTTEISSTDSTGTTTEQEQINDDELARQQELVNIGNDDNDNDEGLSTTETTSEGSNDVSSTTVQPDDASTTEGNDKPFMRAQENDDNTEEPVDSTTENAKSTTRKVDATENVESTTDNEISTTEKVSEVTSMNTIDVNQETTTEALISVMAPETDSRRTSENPFSTVHVGRRIGQDIMDIRDVESTWKELGEPQQTSTISTISTSKNPEIIEEITSQKPKPIESESATSQLIEDTDVVPNTNEETNKVDTVTNQPAYNFDLVNTNQSVTMMSDNSEKSNTNELDLDQTTLEVTTLFETETTTVLYHPVDLSSVNYTTAASEAETKQTTVNDHTGFNHENIFSGADDQVTDLVLTTSPNELESTTSPSQNTAFEHKEDLAQNINFGDNINNEQIEKPNSKSEYQIETSTAEAENYKNTNVNVENISSDTESSYVTTEPTIKDYTTVHEDLITNVHVENISSETESSYVTTEPTIQDYTKVHEDLITNVHVKNISSETESSYVTTEPTIQDYSTVDEDLIEVRTFKYNDTTTTQAPKLESITRVLNDPNVQILKPNFPTDDDVQEVNKVPKMALTLGLIPEEPTTERELESIVKFFTTKTVKEYKVYEVPPENQAFIPLQKVHTDTVEARTQKPLTVKDSNYYNQEEPYFVPFHNYDPSQIRFKPMDRVTAGPEDEIINVGRNNANKPNVERVPIYDYSAKNAYFSPYNLLGPNPGDEYMVRTHVLRDPNPDPEEITPEGLQRIMNEEDDNESTTYSASGRNGENNDEEPEEISEAELKRILTADDGDDPNRDENALRNKEFDSYAFPPHPNSQHLRITATDIKNILNDEKDRSLANIKAPKVISSKDLIPNDQLSPLILNKDLKPLITDNLHKFLIVEDHKISFDNAGNNNKESEVKSQRKSNHRSRTKSHKNNDYKIKSFTKDNIDDYDDPLIIDRNDRRTDSLTVKKPIKHGLFMNDFPEDTGGIFDDVLKNQPKSKASPDFIDMDYYFGRRGEDGNEKYKAFVIALDQILRSQKKKGRTNSKSSNKKKKRAHVLPNSNEESHPYHALSKKKFNNHANIASELLSVAAGYHVKRPKHQKKKHKEDSSQSLEESETIKPEDDDVPPIDPLLPEEDTVTVPKDGDESVTTDTPRDKIVTPKMDDDVERVEDTTANPEEKEEGGGEEAGGKGIGEEAEGKGDGADEGGEEEGIVIEGGGQEGGGEERLDIDAFETDKDIERTHKSNKLEYIIAIPLVPKRQISFKNYETLFSVPFEPEKNIEPMLPFLLNGYKPNKENSKIIPLKNKNNSQNPKLGDKTDVNGKKLLSILIENLIGDGKYAETRRNKISEPVVKSNLNIKGIQILLEHSKADIFHTLNNLHKLYIRTDVGGNLEPFEAVMKDMIASDSEALTQYDWLGSTVEIRAALTKLAKLAYMLIKGELIHLYDLQLLKYSMALFQETIQKHPEPIDESGRRSNPGKSRRMLWDENDSNRGALPKTFKRRRSKKLKNLGSLSKRILNNQRNTRDTTSPKEKRDARQFREFLLDLGDSLKEFHESIKAIASITKFKEQKWFKNIKELYLSKPTRKNVLEVILHLYTERVVRLIDNSAAQGADKNFIKYANNNMKVVNETVEELDILLQVLNALNALNKNDL